MSRSFSILINFMALVAALSLCARSSGAETAFSDSEPGYVEEIDLVSIHSQAVSGSVRLTLDDCISLALTQNARLKASGEDIDAARSQHKEASALLWPVLEYRYRMAPVPTDVDNAFNAFFDGQLTFFNSIHVGIGMPVATFGKLSMAKRLAESGIEAARIRRAQTESEVVFQVKQLYYGIQFARETIKLMEDAANKIDDRIKQEEGKQMWGEYVDWNDVPEDGDDSIDSADKDLPGLDPYDMAQLRSFKLELERRLDEARHNMELAYEGMKFQLDLDPLVEISLDSLSLTPEPARLDRAEEFVKAGKEHHPEMKLVDVGVEARHRQYRLEKRKLLPSAGLGFFVDVGRTTGEIRGLQLTDDFNDPFNFTRAGFGLEVKGTLDFHGAAARIRKARAEYHKASYERMIAHRALSVDNQKAYLEAKRAQDNMRRAKRFESLANQMVFLSKVNLDIGVGEQGRYSDALKAVLLARGQYFKSIFDYNVALARLEQRVGRAVYRNVVPEAPVILHDIHNGEGRLGDDGTYYYGEERIYGKETENGGTTMGLE